MSTHVLSPSSVTRITSEQCCALAAPTSSSPNPPLYERFSALSKQLESELPLPYNFNVLEEKFTCVDNIVVLMQRRGEICTYDKLKRAVQETTRRLGQFLCAVYCSEVGYQ